MTMIPSRFLLPPLVRNTRTCFIRPHPSSCRISQSKQWKSKLRRSFTTEAPHLKCEAVTTLDVPGAVVAIWTLDRPKANAMGFQMIDELERSLESVCQDATTTRCLVLTSSSSRVFSAGADLKERASMSMDETEVFVGRLRQAMQRLAALEIPSIAAVEGVAVGGGLELAVAADLRIASSTSTWGLPETSLSIVPGAGGTQRVSRLIGPAKAKELILTGQRIDGVTAAAMGLVQHVVKPGETLDKALELAWKIAANGPIAVRAAKVAIDQGLEASSMEEALEVERRAYQKVLPTRDRLEGLAAFKEGRKPVYKGE